MVVAFSCKGRGFCPSCGGRRMSALAAQLVDHVIPHVPVRQWVLSLPWSLRYQLAFDAALCRDVLAVFMRVVFGAGGQRRPPGPPLAPVRGGHGDPALRVGPESEPLSRNDPILALNALNDRTAEDEQEGIMHLLMGAVLALRNPRAHTLLDDSPEMVLEHIALISLLAKRVDQATRTEAT
jgi:Protein of unknown function (Hypoth_ymh)/Transposase zinc-binding domain